MYLRWDRRSNKIFRLLPSLAVAYRLASMADDRFPTDEDLCIVHGPGSVVGGVCTHSLEEMRDESRYVQCPQHGIQPKAPGSDGCPIRDCLGTDARPTEAEIEREAESYNRVWPGGAARQQNALDAKEARPPGERDREARESAEGEAGPAPRNDPER